MEKLKIWIEAVRAPFFTATAVPVLLGAAIAWHQTSVFFPAGFILTLLGAVMIHAGLDLINDYYDHLSGVDEANKTPTPFSGGSRMIQRGVLSPGQILKGGILFFSGGAAIGLYLNHILPGNVVLLVGALGVFLAVFYSARPLSIGYTGFGELVCFAGFGPVITLGAYYVQNPAFSWLPVLASVPVGILIALVLYINEFPDYDADKAKNKNTLVVIMGREKAVKFYPVFLALSYAWTAGGVAVGIFPLYALAAFLTVPAGISAVKTAMAHYPEVDKLLPANAATIKFHLSVGLLLSISFVIDKIF